jgi:hypothetical protein
VVHMVVTVLLALKNWQWNMHKQMDTGYDKVIPLIHQAVECLPCHWPVNTTPYTKNKW